MDNLTNRQRQAMQTRRKIFMCAQDLFTRDQYENVKINDICAAAGVSIGAFYHYFPNKESILNEGYRQFDIALENRWNDYVPESTLQSLHFIINCQLEDITSNGDIGAAQFFKHQLSYDEKYILDKNRFFYRIVLQQVQKAIDEGAIVGDAAFICDVVLRATRGLIYDWCLNEGSYDVIEAGDLFLNMIIAYYSPR